jgi:hypothetical protein
MRRSRFARNVTDVFRTTGDSSSMFPIRRGTPFGGIPFQSAPRDTRSRAFASYLAALDAEAPAAAEIAASPTLRA